jgi:hypothetical protein
MSENGKGDKQRPLSVDQETFSNNWDRAFRKNEICEYSGLPTPVTVEDIQTEITKLSNKLKKNNEAPSEYTQTLQSGMFWELYPELSGNWDLDSSSWAKKDVHR